MIEKILKKFYFFTKLSTSLILFFIIVFLGYIFSKAYISNSGNEQSLLINEQINELFVAVKHNAESLNNIKNQISSNEEALSDINSKISKQNQGGLFLDQIENLLEENKQINEQIIQLNKKLENSKNHIQPVDQDNSGNVSMSNLIDLIKLKYENGTDVKKELTLLQKNTNNSHNANFEKMFLLSNSKFIGLENLQIEFDILMKEYLKEYYNNKNSNLFYNYLSKFYTIEPNSTSNFKSDVLKNFSIIKDKLKQKDIQSSLYYLSKVDQSENYFNYWIKEANNYVIFNKNLIFIQKNK